MPFASFSLDGNVPILATAVHNGHELRPEVLAAMSIDEATRRREEDAHTGYFAARFSNHAIVNRSRFEVDINRPRHEAVYKSGDDAWGLDLWGGSLPDEIANESLLFYDNFYEKLGNMLDSMVARHGGFVLYDIHSYNHRRHGQDAAPEPEIDNPTVNLGTGSLPEKWKGVAETFMKVIGSETFHGEPIDVGENVKFQGRQVAAWTHENYGEVGCALAIEFKKVFMDEWTDDVDWEAQSNLADALIATTEPVLSSWEDACR